MRKYLYRHFHLKETGPSLRGRGDVGQKQPLTSANLSDAGADFPRRSRCRHLLSDCPTDATDHINQSLREVEFAACQVGQTQTRLIVFCTFHLKNGPGLMFFPSDQIINLHQLKPLKNSSRTKN